MKKGFTLIETIIVIMVISIISIVGIMCLKTGLKISLIKRVDNFSVNTLSFIYSCQNKCKLENTTGYITVYNDRIEFKIQGNLWRSLKTDRGVKVTWNNGREIIVDNCGRVTTAGTITIENRSLSKKIVIWPCTGGVHIEK